MARDLDKITRMARRQGWIVEQRKSGHVRFTPPDKNQPAYTTSLTPSDVRATQNLVAALRRRGFEYDQRGGTGRKRPARSTR